MDTWVGDISPENNSLMLTHTIYKWYGRTNHFLDTVIQGSSVLIAYYYISQSLTNSTSESLVRLWQWQLFLIALSSFVISWPTKRLVLFKIGLSTITNCHCLRDLIIAIQLGCGYFCIVLEWVTKKNGFWEILCIWVVSLSNSGQNSFHRDIDDSVARQVYPV